MALAEAGWCAKPNTPSKSSAKSTPKPAATELKSIEALEADAASYVRVLWDDDPKKAGISKKRRDGLMAYRHWSEDTLKRWEIGWDGKRFTIPVRDAEGGILNIRRYNPNLEIKIIGTTGFQTTLFNTSSLLEHTQVLICEGETDCITACQAGLDTGDDAFAVVTGTGGAETWKSEWNESFRGKKVWIVYDADDAGRKGTKKVRAALSGVSDDVRIVNIGSVEGANDISDILSSEQGLESLRSLINEAEELGGDDPKTLDWAQAHTPSKYLIDDKCVAQRIFKDGEEIAVKPLNTAPMWAHVLGKDVDGDKHYLGLTWETPMGWNSKLFDREVVMDHNALKRLASQGIPVTSKSAPALVDFVSEFERENWESLPYELFTKRNGWHDGIFVLGSEQFGTASDGDKTLRFHAGDGEESNFVQGLVSSGDWETWQHAARVAWDCSAAARFILGASLTAPLLNLLNIRTFGAHMHCETRGGKTAMAKLAASVAGNPEEIVATMQSTLNYIEIMASLMCDLPLILDEFQLRGNMKDDWAKVVIYMLTQGKGKGRASRNSEMKAVKTWRTVALTTGEQALISEDDLGGQTSRVIEIPDRPIPDEAVSRMLHETVKEHYGLAMPRFLEKLVLVDRLSLIERHKILTAKIAELSPNMHGAMMPAHAAVVLGVQMFSEWLLDTVMTDDEALESVTPILNSREERLPYWQRAHKEFRTWFRAVQHNSFTDASLGKPTFKTVVGFECYGCYFKDGVVWITPGALRRYLTSLSLPPGDVIRNWAANDLIKVEMSAGKRRYALMRKIDGETVTVYHIFPWADGDEKPEL